MFIAAVFVLDLNCKQNDILWMNYLTSCVLFKQYSENKIPWLSSAVSLPKYPQQLGLNQDKTNSWNTIQVSHVGSWDPTMCSS